MNKAWFCICIPEDKPDGPGDFWGFFPTKEWAEREADQSDCTFGNHILVYGEGPYIDSDLKLRNGGFLSGGTKGWSEVVDYWFKYPNEIPERMVNWFEKYHGWMRPKK